MAAKSRDISVNDDVLRVADGGRPLISEPLHGVLTAAIAERASDVHIDPVPTGKVVRFRVDGMVHEKQHIALENATRLLNLVKIAADFDIDHSFRPQEGLLRFPANGEEHDIRVSIMPSVGGREAIHMRFLSTLHRIMQPGELGLRNSDLDRTLEAINSPNGLILISGPTGAGKTASMYALANALDLRSSVAVSIEDPVEFDLPYVRQVQVDEPHNMTMYEGLRVLLRMDPDAILVGEIRDRDSAVTSARAALTGRLVLATLHAPSSVMAVEALHHLGVPRYVVGGSLRLVITQDLVRRLCEKCHEETQLSEEEAELFRQYNLPIPEHVWKAAGCEACNGYGYHGRIGVFEVAKVDRDLGHDISMGLDQQELQVRLLERGTRPLLVDALEKVAEGLTSIDEVRRLIMPRRTVMDAPSGAMQRAIEEADWLDAEAEKT